MEFTFQMRGLCCVLAFEIQQKNRFEMDRKSFVV